MVAFSTIAPACQQFYYLQFERVQLDTLHLFWEFFITKIFCGEGEGTRVYDNICVPLVHQLQVVYLNSSRQKLGYVRRSYDDDISLRKMFRNNSFLLGIHSCNPPYMTLKLPLAAFLEHFFTEHGIKWHNIFSQRVASQSLSHHHPYHTSGNLKKYLHVLFFAKINICHPSCLTYICITF